MDGPELKEDPYAVPVAKENPSWLTVTCPTCEELVEYSLARELFGLRAHCEHCGSSFKFRQPFRRNLTRASLTLIWLLPYCIGVLLFVLHLPETWQRVAAPLLMLPMYPAWYLTMIIGSRQARTSHPLQIKESSVRRLTDPRGPDTP